jgi:hypothetical protein
LIPAYASEFHEDQRFPGQQQDLPTFMLRTRVICYLFVGLLSACAYQQPVTTILSPGITRITDQVQYWWHVKYRIHWAANTEPDLFIDLLLADAVIEPILLKHYESISYWRFHRRAARDDAGHQFSFIFYSDKNTAQSINQEINHNEITKKMLEMNILQKIQTDDPDRNTLAEINAISDMNWPVTLQNAWPAYIMGVSSTWLQLINQEIRDERPVSDINYLLDRYKQADVTISKLWYEQGQHAFLHHLNAIFGYEPVLIKEPLQF